MRAAAGKAGAIVAMAGALHTASGCGLAGDDEADAVAATPATTEGWVARAERICTDGTQEATALPLPPSTRQIAADASARTEILATVRDGLVTLGRPEDVDEDDLATFLGELETDIQQLADAADDINIGSGGTGFAVIDESAGQVAGTLGLPGCAAFVNAVARTP